jgi:hypothetical protein
VRTRVSLIGVTLLVGYLTALVVGSTTARAESASGGIRTLSTPTPVVSLAADGPNAAVATACGAGRYGPYQTYGLYSWNPIRRSVVSMARPRQRRCFDSSTGEGIWEAGIAGPRPAWVSFAGGNDQQARLATASSRKPRSVAFLTYWMWRNTGNTEGDWVGNVHGDGSLLVFNTWSLCDSLFENGKCHPGNPVGFHIYNEKIWRVLGQRKRLVFASRGESTVLSVAAGRILVHRAYGSLELRRADGRLLHTIHFDGDEVRGAVLDARELVVLTHDHGLTWRVFDLRSGRQKGALPADPHAVVADVARGLLVYTIGRVVHVLRLSDAQERAFVAPVHFPVQAQLEPSGLFYSYPLHSEGRVRFVPFDEIGLSR